MAITIVPLANGQTLSAGVSEMLYPQLTGGQTLIVSSSTVTVEYTTDSQEAVQAETASWDTWPVVAATPMRAAWVAPFPVIFRLTAAGTAYTVQAVAATVADIGQLWGLYAAGFGEVDATISTIGTLTVSTAMALTSGATLSAAQVNGRLNLALTDATTALTATQAANAELHFTGTLGAAYTVTVPATRAHWIVTNGTDNTVTVKVSGLTGIAVATNKAQILFSNGTDVFAAAAAL